MVVSYLSFLLRLRRVDNAGKPVWRISAEVPGCPENRHFKSLEDLCIYLLECIKEAEELEKPDPH